MTRPPLSVPSIPVSARTVIESSFDPSGIAELSYVYDLGLAVGLPDQTVRLAIRRMERGNELRQEGRGRAGRLVRTEQGRSWAVTAARLIAFAFAQDAGHAPWDGNWRIYTFNVPESHRPERDALRATLTKLGAVALSPATYISPHELHDELSSLLPPRLVFERISQATAHSLHVPGCENALDIAERFWPATEVLNAYEELEKHLRGTADETPVGFFPVIAAALQLAQLFDRALRIDPLLPPELRAADWPPRTTRSRFAAAWNELQGQAPNAPIFHELSNRKPETP